MAEAVLHYQSRPDGGEWAVCGAHRAPARRAALSRMGMFGARILPTTCLPERATCKRCTAFIKRYGPEALPWMVR